jgi:hypothetical protein
MREGHMHAVQSSNFFAKALQLLRGAAVAGALLAAGPAGAVQTLHGDTVEATGPQSDVAFLSGHSVHVSSTSSDDVYAAGETIRFDKAAADHAFAAGQTIHVQDTDARALIFAGRTLDFDTGQARSDVVAFGQDVSFQSGFKIGGTAVLMGRNIDLQAPVGRDVIAAGQDVRIDSAVAGNVRAEGGRVVIGPNARIGGDLSYRADSIDISPQAVITGKRTILPARAHEHGWKGRAPTMEHRLRHDLWGAAAFTILALALAALFPGLMNRAGGMVARNPLIAGAIGIAALAAGPVVAVILLITLLGAPLAATLLAILFAVVFLGLGGAASGLGLFARRLTRGSAATEAPKMGPLLGWTLLGSLVLCALGAIPYVGGWIWMLACFVGLGAVVVKGREALAAD